MSKPSLLACVTAAAVRAERERTGSGMMECKLRLTRAAMLEMVDQAKTIDDLRPILAWLVDTAH